MVFVPVEALVEAKKQHKEELEGAQFRIVGEECEVENEAAHYGKLESEQLLRHLESFLHLGQSHQFVEVDLRLLGFRLREDIFYRSLT